MDIPIELFLSFIAFSLAMGIIGIWKKIPLLLFIGGALITFWAITTDNIQIGFAEPQIIDSTENIIYTAEYHMNVTTTGVSSALNSANLFATAERPANTASVIYNQPISCISLGMARQGTPPAQTAIIGILDDDNQIIKQFGTIEVSTMLTSQKRYTFCLNNHDYWVITLNNKIGVFYNGGSSGNGLLTYSDTGNPFDGINTIRSTLNNAGTWTDTTGNDMIMLLIHDKAEIQSTPIYGEPEPIPIQFTQYPKILFALMGSLIMIGGALIWKAIEE